MAGPGGREVGRISIRVLPDTSAFGPSLEAYLQRTEHRLRMEIPVSLDLADVARMEAQLELLTRDRSIDIDLDGFTRGLGSATSFGVSRFKTLATAIAAVSVAVGALVNGLPAAFALFGAPLAAVVAGWDGIKEAARSLSDEMEHLRTAVSATFATGLSFAFERLAAVFPVLEAGLVGIADSMSKVFSAVATQLGLAAAAGGPLERIFANVKTFIDAMAPAATAFVTSMLTLADVGTKVAASFGPALAKQFQDFANVISDFAANGLLQKAMEGIGHAILGVMKALQLIVLAGLIAAAAFEVIGESIAKAWATIKAATVASVSAISSGFSTAVSFVTSLPGRLVSALSGLADKLAAIGRNAATAFATGLMGPLAAVVDKVQAAIGKIVDAFTKALRLGSPSRVMTQIGAWTGEGFQIGMERSLAGVTSAALDLANAPIRATSVQRLVNSAGSPSAAQAANRPRELHLKSGALEIVNGKAYITGVISEELLAVTG